MTPRKPKQRQQQTTHRPTPSLIQVSDYDSDVQNYALHAHDHPPTTRTNTELNLSVLRRHNPAILTILSIAANAVIYRFTPTTQQWEKSGIEGTLFVCETTAPASSNGALDAGYCVVVLNRRGLDNLILDVGLARDVEVTPELLILRFHGGEEVEGEEGTAGMQKKVMGVWIHKDKDDTREINMGLIQQCWEKVTAATKMAPPGAGGSNAFSSMAGNGAVQGDGAALAGRRITLTDLFGQQNS